MKVLGLGEIKILPKGSLEVEWGSYPGLPESQTSPFPSRLLPCLGQAGSPRTTGKMCFCWVWHQCGCISSQSSDAVAGLHARAFYPSFHTILLTETEWPRLNRNSAKPAVKGLAGAWAAHPKRDVHREWGSHCLALCSAEPSRACQSKLSP